MTVIDTSISSTATAYSNQRKIDRCQNGVLWMVYDWTTSSTSQVFRHAYSTDDGATWTDALFIGNGSGGSARTYTVNSSFFIDVDDYAHLVFKDNSNGYIYYRRGTPNAGRTSYTWSAAISVMTTNVGYNYPDIVAHREGTGWVAHIVMYAQVSNNLATYSRMAITSGGTISQPQTPTTIGGGYGVSTSTFPSIDFNHTGDGKTIAGSTPHLYAAWSAGATGAGKGIRFKKATYSGGSWTWGTEQEIDPIRYAPSSDYWLNCLFDGTRVVIGGWWYGDSDSYGLYLCDRDAADTTTTLRSFLVGAALSDRLMWGTLSYDGGGNVHVFGAEVANVAGSRQLRTRMWDRGAGTLDAVVEVDATVGIPWVSAKRGYSGAKIEFIYTDGSASPYDVTYESITLNTEPTAPTIDSPSDGLTQDVNETLTIDWTFNDPDAGDTQSAYTLRRRIGAGSFEYWNGTSWTASEDGSTKIVTATTQQSLAASWGADGDGDHYYSVKTWDAADAGPSPWSSEARVVPSAQDNPTLTAPANLASVGAQETATWTVATQTKYRVVVSDTSSASDMDAGTLEYDSGNQVSASTSQAIEFPTNSVTRYVRIRTWNDEGLASDIDEHQVSVSYTPPATPTLVVTAGSPTGAIGVDITNPGTGATEQSNDIYRRIVGSSGDGIRVATGVAVDGSFTDWAVASGVAYEYRAKAIGDNGTTAFSAWTA